jgi:hypothetical protein
MNPGGWFINQGLNVGFNTIGNQLAMTLSSAPAATIGVM